MLRGSSEAAAPHAPPAQKSLHDWLATTSHDARTPLSSIQARRCWRHSCRCVGGCGLTRRPPRAQVSCQLLSERVLCSEGAELLGAISASAHVLLTLVQHVMLLKRLDAGECDVAPAVVPIRELVAEVLATARVGLAQQYGATVLWDVAAPLPATVMVRACAYMVSRVRDSAMCSEKRN